MPPLVLILFLGPLGGCAGTGVWPSVLPPPCGELIADYRREGPANGKS